MTGERNHHSSYFNDFFFSVSHITHFFIHFVKISYMKTDGFAVRFYVEPVECLTRGTFI